MKYLLTTVLLFSFSQANAVTYIGGNELLKYCDEYISKSTTFNGGLCGGYVVSVVDMAATFEAWGKMTQQFCIPNGVTTDQLVQITYKALKEEPESLHLTAASLVINALTKAFPCVNNPVDTVIYPRIVPESQSQPLRAHTRESPFPAV